MSARPPSKLETQLIKNINQNKAALENLKRAEQKLIERSRTEQDRLKQRRISQTLALTADTIKNVQKSLKDNQRLLKQKQREQDRLAAQLPQIRQRKKAELDKLKDQLPQTALPASVRKAVSPIGRQLRKLRKQRRTAIDPARILDLEKRIADLEILQRRAIIEQFQKFTKIFEERRLGAIRTSQQQARSAALKQTEARAVAAQQGVAVGTIGKGAVGTGGIASIVTPTGEQKKVVLPTTSSELAKTPITDLPKPTAAGGRALQVELKETLTATDKTTTEKLNELGGVDVKVKLADAIKIDEPPKPSVPKPETLQEKAQQLIAEQQEEKRAKIPEEDIEKRDIVARVGDTAVTEQITLTQEAQQKKLAENVSGNLFFAKPQDLALGLPSQIKAQPKKVKKEVRVKAGEQPTAQQLEGATAIVQEGVGGTVRAAATRPISNFFENIQRQIQTFRKQQEQIAKTTQDPIQRELANIAVGIGKLGETVTIDERSPIATTASFVRTLETGEFDKQFSENIEKLGDISRERFEVVKRSQDPIERGIANLESFGASIGEQVLGDIGFALNISKQFTQEAGRAQITDTGFDIARAITQPLPEGTGITIPETFTNIAVGEGIGGVARATGFATSEQGAASTLGTAFGPVGERLQKFIDERGFAAAAGSLIGVVLPFNPRPLSPLRIIPVAQTTGRILRTVEPVIVNPKFKFGKVTIGGAKGVKIVETPEITTLGKSLVLGRGGEKSIPLLSKTAVEGIVKGSPISATKSVQKFVSEASPIGRGFELATEKGFASKILTSEKVLSEKVAQGKLLPEQKDLPKEIRNLVNLIVKTPNVPQQRFLKATEQLTQAVETGKESEALAKIISDLPREIKGGFAQSFLVIGERARKDIDIDFGKLFRGEQRAIKAAEKAKLELTLASRGTNRKFTIKFTEGGPKLISTGGKLGDQERKVIEFLTKREGVDASQLDSLNKDLNQVFGQAVNRGTTKIKLPFEQQGEVDKLQGQSFKKIASVLTEQGPLTESALGQGQPVQFLKQGFKDLSKTEKGFRLGPPDFRLKDLVDLFGEGQIVQTLATVSRQKGKTALAEELIKANERIKRFFPEVDFQAAVGQTDIIDFGTLAKSDVGSVAALRKAGKLAGDVSPAAVPSTLAQVGKGAVSSGVAGSLADDIKQKIDLSKESKKSKETLNLLKSITSSASKPSVPIVEPALANLASKPTGLLTLLTPKRSKQKFGDINPNFVAFVVDDQTSLINLNLATFGSKGIDEGKAVATQIVPIITHETLHNVLRKTIREDEIVDTQKGFLGRTFKKPRDVSGDLDNLTVDIAGKKTLQKGLDNLIDDASPATARIFREQAKPIIQNLIGNDIRAAFKQSTKGIDDTKDSLSSIGKNVKENVGGPFTPAQNTNILKDISLAAAKEKTANRASKLSSQTTKELGASNIVASNLTDSKGQAKLTDIGSKSLLKNLERLGSIGESTSDNQLGLPDIQPVSVASPPSTSTTKPVRTIPLLDIPSITTPSPARAQPPSKPPTKTPTPAKTPTPVSLVTGTAKPRIPPPVPPPSFILQLLGEKDRKIKRKLPAFAKQLTFIADPADPLRAGVFATAGVPQLVSGRSKIFKSIDNLLAKSRQQVNAIIPLGERIGVERARIGAGPKPKRKKQTKKQRTVARQQRISTQKRGLI